MRYRWPLFLFGMCPLLVLGSVSDPLRKYEEEPAPWFLFQDRPVPPTCLDRPLKVLPPAGKAYMMVTISPQAPYARTRLEHLTFSRAEIPALTLVADLGSGIEINGDQRDGWAMRLCAQGEGDNEADALGRMQTIAMTRTGGSFSLDGRSGGPFHDARADLWVDAPADAPVVVHALGAVRVRDMKGPVRISAAHGRTTILNSSGRIDVNAGVIDYMVSSGTITLNSTSEINLKFTAQRFDGKLTAEGRRPVRALMPLGFETRFQAVVDRRSDFICRADICSHVRERRENGLYTFTYGDDGSTDRPPVWLRSENSTVVIDNPSCPEPFKSLGACGPAER
jgi:hypothetical protein